MRAPHFSRTDWVGDGVIVVCCGVALLVSLWLPWANVRDYPKQNFTYALTKPAEIKYILYTD